MALGLDALEDENPELIDAMRGLCKGLYSGLTCGTLTAGACLLSMVDVRAAEEHMIARLVEWFEMTYESAYGGISCAQILDNNPMNKFERCPVIIEQTYEKCRELLAEAGHAI
jgi:hypothetical protein